MKLLSIFFFLFLFCLPLKSQQTDIKSMIKAWKIADLNQSKRCQVFYDSLNLKKDTAEFRRTVDELHRYLKTHYNRRVEVRTMMYEVLGYWMFKLKSDAEKADLALQAIKLAYPLRDEQLNAELYALSADNPANFYDYILYNMKALEIQQKIGFEHFNYVQNRFNGLSDGFFRSGDYENSIKYGLGYLKYKEDHILYWNPHIYILQLDILGSGYKRLQQYDSCYHYYHRLLDSIPTMLKDKDEYTRQIWTGIAKGNMGEALVMQNKPDEASPLIYEYLNISLASQDSINIAMALNACGKLYFAKRQYPLSIRFWRQAWNISERINATWQLIDASEGLSKAYKNAGMPDSALYFYDSYHQYSTIQANRMKDMQLNSVRKQIAFDDLQNSLMKTETHLSRARSTRNTIMVGLILTSIIFLLLYNRKTLKDERMMEKLRHKQETTQKEIEYAKSQLLNFKRNIQEKNSLIEGLYAKLNLDKTGTKEIPENLLTYTLIDNERWEEFRVEFDKVYPLFFLKLNQIIKRPSPAAERLSALILLRFNDNDIAHTLGIGKESVARSKRRLRAAIGLSPDESLTDYITSLAE